MLTAGFWHLVKQRLNPPPRTGFHVPLRRFASSKPRCTRLLVRRLVGSTTCGGSRACRFTSYAGVAQSQRAHRYTCLNYEQNELVY